MKKLIDKAAVLIEALPYIQKFRGSIVVVKFGGSAMEDKELVRKTMRDVVFMECVGMRPVVVHGGGKDISARLRELNIKSRFVNGLRVSCPDTIEVVDDVLHNVVNKRLADAVREAGGVPEPISGKDIISGRKKDPEVCRESGELVDFGAVGSVTGIDTEPILRALDEERIPIITPLANDPAEGTLNVNADSAACEIATALKARKLVFLSDVPGILRDPSDEDSLISTITVEEVDGLIEKGVISGGMAPKIKSAEGALTAGVNKVHIIDGRLRHALMLEIFTDSGVGTQIVKNADGN
jgi:acetylglutamate kinase